MWSNFDFPVTTTIQEAAVEIQKSNFAIYQVSPSTAQKLRAAWLHAKRILNGTPSEGWTRIVRGHLHGYNVPSRAKRIFRAFPFSKEQPWPDEKFCKVSQHLAGDLHGILSDCVKSLGKLTADAGSRCKTDDEGERRSTKRRRVGIQHHTSEIDRCKCPLDFFLYHNQDASAENCSEHIDRGLLIAVCLTDIPGLELKVRRIGDANKASCWICPEAGVCNSRLYNEIADDDFGCSDLICIMSGAQLVDTVDADIPPCIHRVRSKLKRSRLSISYELRQATSR